MGQDWSEIWLQQFSGTVTVWPKAAASDFIYILSDPNPERLARMLHFGKQSAFPKLLFIKNRLKIESAVMNGLQLFSPQGSSRVMSPIISRRRRRDTDTEEQEQEKCDPMVERLDRNLPERFSDYKDESHYAETSDSASLSAESSRPHTPSDTRRGSLIEEMRRQSAVFFDNANLYTGAAADDGAEGGK